jgi:DnaK suppressor protein
MDSNTVSQTIRQELLQEQERLRQQLAELGIGEAAGLSYDTNFADTSQVTAERGEVAALASSLQDSLGEVERAMEKIDANTFGSCERCQVVIPSARLEAMPTSRFCIDCANATR